MTEAVWQQMVEITTFQDTQAQVRKLTLLTGGHSVGGWFSTHSNLTLESGLPNDFHNSSLLISPSEKLMCFLLECALFKSRPCRHL